MPPDPHSPLPSDPCPAIRPAIMSPGTYLRLRRHASRLSLEDLALRVDTSPPVSCRTRIEWLRAIEDGTAALGLTALAALYRVYRFDPLVLIRLCDIATGGSSDDPPRLCMLCGCSEYDACMDSAGGRCGWAGPDLCDSHHGHPPFTPTPQFTPTPTHLKVVS